MAFPKQRAGLISTVVGDELLILDPATNNTHRLAGVARHVWDRCDGQHDRNALIRGVVDAARPPLQTHAATDIVDATFAGLSQQNLLAEDSVATPREFSRRDVGRALIASLITTMAVPARAEHSADCSLYEDSTECDADPCCVWIVQLCVPKSVASEDDPCSAS